MPKHHKKCNKQSNKQDDFWYSIIQKYERRNADLETETKVLQKNVNNMEAFLTPYLSYKMNKYLQKCPGANVASLLRSAEYGPIEHPEIETKIDLSQISVFSIVDNDVFYIDAIDTIIADGKRIEEQIKRLKVREAALKEAAREVAELLEDGTSHFKVAVDADLLETTNVRLLKENEALKYEKVDLLVELDSLHEMEEPLLKRLAEHQEKFMEIQGKDCCCQKLMPIPGVCGCGVSDESLALCLRRKYTMCMNEYDRQVQLSVRLKEIIGNLRKAAMEMEAMVVRRSNCTDDVGAISMDEFI